MKQFYWNVMYKVLYIFNVYNLMCLDMHEQLQYHSHSQCNRHTQHLPESVSLFLHACVMRTLTLGSFAVHNAVLLTIGTMLYSRSPELTHCVQQALHHWTTTPHLALHAASGNYHSAFCFYDFHYFIHLIQGTSCWIVFLCIYTLACWWIFGCFLILAIVLQWT